MKIYTSITEYRKTNNDKIYKIERVRKVDSWGDHYVSYSIINPNGNTMERGFSSEGRAIAYLERKVGNTKSC
jgi:hypothetical protein